MRRFDVIGTHDYRTAFIEALSKLIGAPLSTHIRANMTPLSNKRVNVLADAKANARLRHLLAGRHPVL
jgi:hypothetical protein